MTTTTIMRAMTTMTSTKARMATSGLDPENAKKMVAEIARVLSEASPADAATFKANAEKLTGELDTLEKEIASELQPLKGKPFVVFHDAYQYFERRRFGMTAVGSITVTPKCNRPPSAFRRSAPSHIA